MWKVELFHHITSVSPACTFAIYRKRLDGSETQTVMNINCSITSFPIVRVYRNTIVPFNYAYEANKGCTLNQKDSCVKSVGFKRRASAGPCALQLTANAFRRPARPDILAVENGKFCPFRGDIIPECISFY